jgi:hypothetical protein
MLNHFFRVKFIANGWSTFAQKMVGPLIGNLDNLNKQLIKNSLPLV